MPETLEGALRHLFGLMAPADVHACRDQYSREIEALSMKMLAACCSSRACFIQKYNIPSVNGERPFQYGPQLFEQKAANLLVAANGFTITDQLHIIHHHELWLTEDLKFFRVSSVGVMARENNQIEFMMDCRKILKQIQTPADLFFDAKMLLCNLYDICYGSFPGEELPAAAEP